MIPGSKRLVLDLTNVGYIDSSGLGALVSAYMHARRAHCDLEIANPRQQIKDLFSTSKLAAVFEGRHEWLAMTPDESFQRQLAFPACCYAPCFFAA